jgi:hypothetical protein
MFVNVAIYIPTATVSSVHPNFVIFNILAHKQKAQLNELRLR